MNKYQKVANKLAKIFESSGHLEVSVQSCSRRFIKQSKYFKWSIKEFYEFKNMWR